MNITPTGKDYVGSDDLYTDVQCTMRLAAEMNTGYHTEAEVRAALSSPWVASPLRTMFPSGRIVCWPRNTIPKNPRRAIPCSPNPSS